MPATLAEPHPLEVEPLVVGIVNYQCIAALVLIGQIKLTRIHAADLFLPGVRVKRNRRPSLYNVERSANHTFAGVSRQTLSLCSCDGLCVLEFGDHQVHQKEWWSLTGSNRRHPACKAGALPAELRPHFLGYQHSIQRMKLGWPG